MCCCPVPDPAAGVDLPMSGDGTGGLTGTAWRARRATCWTSWKTWRSVASPWSCFRLPTDPACRIDHRVGLVTQLLQERASRSARRGSTPRCARHGNGFSRAQIGRLHGPRRLNDRVGRRAGVRALCHERQLSTPTKPFASATRFFRKLLKELQYVPRVIVTDKLRSYGAAKRDIMPSVEHRQSRI